MQWCRADDIAAHKSPGTQLFVQQLANAYQPMAGVFPLYIKGLVMRKGFPWHDASWQQQPHYQLYQNRHSANIISFPHPTKPFISGQLECPIDVY